MNSIYISSSEITITGVVLCAVIFLNFVCVLALWNELSLQWIMFKSMMSRGIYIASIILLVIIGAGCIYLLPQTLGILVYEKVATYQRLTKPVDGYKVSFDKAGNVLRVDEFRVKKENNSGYRFVQENK